MSNKLGVVLVHGFWGGAAHWAKVIVELDRRGYDSLHAVAPDAGESLGQISEWNVAAAAAARNIAPDSDGYVWIKQDKFRESFCQDLTADEALVMAVTQKAPVGSTFGDAVSDPAWKKKPAWYQVSASDRMIHPDTERRMAERMNPRSTIELDASHASLASQPDAIADLIDQAATALT